MLRVSRGFLPTLIDGRDHTTCFGTLVGRCYDLCSSVDLESKMATRTSTQLEPGKVYARENLRDLFDITDATLNNGIFQPKGTQSVWLFVTEEKTPDRVQYTDHLDGDALLMQGQTEGRTDKLIRDHAEKGLELLVFHRAKKYEHEGAGFRYLGPFEYIRSFGSRPTSFVLMRELRRKSFKYGKPSWLWVLEAVRRLGGRATRKEISNYVVERVPNFKLTNIGADLSLITVNDYARSAWDPNRIERRTDGWNPIDALFRRGKGQETVYELYDPAKHGVWAQVPDAKGVMRPRLVGDSPEIVQAQEKAEAASVFDVSDDTDARQRVAASIVLRRGQPKFRRALLAAYENRCAVTECPVVEILEGAHIKPYKGDHTNHVTNGLLLRADIHTLFDLGLLRVHPETLQVEVSERARASYPGVHGSNLTIPADPSASPDPSALKEHYERSGEAF